MNFKRLISFSSSILVVLSIPILISLQVNKGSESVEKLHAAEWKLDLSDDWASQVLKNMSNEEKLGQFIVACAEGNSGPEHLQRLESSAVKGEIGGLLFVSGEKSNLIRVIRQFQSKVKIPLFIGLDTELDAEKNVFDNSRFPLAYSLGAAGDLALTERMAAMVAQEFQSMGVHLNFSTSADVYKQSDLDYNVERSFGENPKKVAEQTKAFVKGLESNGSFSCLKHFPGMGSARQLTSDPFPVVASTLKTLEGIDFYPFREGIDAGASGILIGNFSVPALDESGAIASESKQIITETLRKKMGFKGLVISEQLRKNVSSNLRDESLHAVRAFEAGCDLILVSEERIPSVVSALRNKIGKGGVTQNELDARCLKILRTKYDFVVKPKAAKSFTAGEVKQAKNEVYEKAVTVVNNEHDLLPLKRLNQRIALVSIGSHARSFQQSIALFADVEYHHYFSMRQAVTEFQKVKKNYDLVITSLHAGLEEEIQAASFGDKWQDYKRLFPEKTKEIVVLFGNHSMLKQAVNANGIAAIVLGYENNSFSHLATAQLIFGAVPASGRLPYTINERYPREKGIALESSGRLKFSMPEELGIAPEKLLEIDKIAQNGVLKGAFPGCQIVVAVEGKIIYRKSFGTFTFESNDSIHDNAIFDIASVSKIAGSTAGIMKLQTEGKFSLRDKLGAVLPEKEMNKEFSSIVLRDMMAHQAGLVAWIPFYKKTLKNGSLNPVIYASEKSNDFTGEVAENIWIKKGYSDTILRQILASPLGSKKYLYSDLGYYFIQQIIEKKSGKKLHEFLHEELYEPMGLRFLRYQPKKHFALKDIVPTENDKVFRKQLVKGYVHDPGAAMMGGVGGHAGLFSNATDLASLMQVFLNKGMYGNVRYFSNDVVEEYTKAQFAGNRRGAGFDRPNTGGGGPCHASASELSFGHSGFTGTFVWADPAQQINYVFLSNRVCPDQENWKIRDMHIRTEIQGIIYQVVASRKKK
jgi:beta-N-acetylhexosaminidase